MKSIFYYRSYIPKHLQLKNPGPALLLIDPVSVYLDVEDSLHL